MRTSIVVMTLVLALATAVAAQKPGRSHDRGAEWKTPDQFAAKANPFRDREDLAAGGAKVFRERCSVCHGEDARGTSEAPDLTALHVQRQSDGELFWKITSGNTRAGMPTFSFLAEPQRWQLVLHLRQVAR